MFIELTEALDCPRCREGLGLVAFVAETERRRVLRGHLGCPVCEAEFRIARGAIRFGAAGSPDEPDPDPALAVRLAALLGLDERGSAVLLGPGLAPLAAALARSVERVEILAWLGVEGVPAGWDASTLAAGVNPLVGAAADRWPVRRGVLDGVALRGGRPGFPDEAARALRPGGRLVLIDPGAEVLGCLAELGLDELASDPSAWVGRRR